MISPFSNSRSYIIPYFLLVMMAACSFQKEKAEDSLDTLATGVEEEEMQLVQIGLQQLPDWVNYWKAIEPEFDPSAFKASVEDSYEPLELPEENHIVPGSPFYPHLLPHPEGDGVVDIYSYKVVTPEGNSPFFNPDSEVTYFKSNGMRERLLFIGPSGAFEAAVWVSPSHLLVSGHFEDESGFTPKVWLVFPEEHRYILFNNPLHSKSYPREGYLKRKMKQINF